MKYLDEFRDAGLVSALANEIRRIAKKPCTIMEICGGQTHSIVKYGLDAILPDFISIIHGPGCPVCVTPLELIDKALLLAAIPEVIFCSFGDMLRVPGTRETLFAVKARGGDVRIVYSPLDALTLAKKNPAKQVVFFAVGFETTAPATAMAVFQAKQDKTENFSLLTAHVLVPPAINAILSSPRNRVQAFLAAGHVCTVMGYREYETIAREFKVPMAVTGFEPVDILRGFLSCIGNLEKNNNVVDNQYSRSVKRDGNIPAKDLMERVFTKVDRSWRGIGLIPTSGLGLKNEYNNYDAEYRFNLRAVSVQESTICKAGLVLMGEMKPHDCQAFGNPCTPEHPLGAPMVSNEGACAAYYKYRRSNPERFDKGAVE